MEIWKKIKDTDYSVSSEGKVRNDKKNKILKQNMSGNYYAVSNRRVLNERYVHRIVAKVFCDNPNNKPCVDHIDGNKLNNRADNLRWCTRSENKIYGEELGLFKNTRKAVSESAKKNNPIYKSKKVNVYIDGVFYKTFCSFREAEKDLELSTCFIGDYFRGRNRKQKKYSFTK